MYAHFKGTIDSKFSDRIILDVNDIGYEIYMPESEILSLEDNKNKVKIYTYLNVREDDMKLFGFTSLETLEFFKKLISVSGVGPKVALGIISNVNVSDMCVAIATDNIATLKSIPGIGPKMAQKIIFELNEKYRIKGEYESVISQLNEVEENIETLNEQIDNIDNYLFSGDFETLLKEQVKKFNKIFSNISQELYGEKYALTFKKETNKKEQQFYKFNAFNANMSSGKKQGEILCFDLAYLLFADEEGLPCLHFLLNDKKELMHDNQLIKVAEFIQNKNIQLVISILKDKLPKAVLDKAHIAVELSQQEKLFRIENG